MAGLMAALGVSADCGDAPILQRQPPKKIKAAPVCKPQSAGKQRCSAALAAAEAQAPGLRHTQFAPTILCALHWHAARAKHLSVRHDVPATGEFFGVVQARALLGCIL